MAKLSLVNFFGYCFCITQFIPRCTHAGCYTGNLLLKLSHPPLPLKGQSHALVLEYLVKNTFMTATVKSTPKKKKSTQLHALFAFDRATFSVSSIAQEKEIEAQRKKHTYVNYFWPLTSIFSLSLLFCKTDYWKQILEAGGKK